MFFEKNPQNHINLPKMPYFPSAGIIAFVKSSFLKIIISIFTKIGLENPCFKNLV